MFLHRPSFVDSFCVGGNCENNFFKKIEVFLSLPCLELMTFKVISEAATINECIQFN